MYVFNSSINSQELSIYSYHEISKHPDPGPELVGFCLKGQGNLRSYNGAIEGLVLYFRTSEVT